jgi:hypothetical protein
MLLNNDQLSHWFLGAVLGWALSVLIFGIPIFHLLLDFSIAKIILLACICCGLQLCVTPSLYSARATAQNPEGFVNRRMRALFTWISLTTLALFYFIQRDWPDNPQSHQARIIFSIALPGILIVLGIILHYSVPSIARMSKYVRGKNA